MVAIAKCRERRRTKNQMRKLRCRRSGRAQEPKTTTRRDGTEPMAVHQAKKLKQNAVEPWETENQKKSSRDKAKENIP